MSFTCSVDPCGTFRIELRMLICGLYLSKRRSKANNLANRSQKANSWALSPVRTQDEKGRIQGRRQCITYISCTTVTFCNSHQTTVSIWGTCVGSLSLLGVNGG
ncbi:hypothetical protein E2C01_038940 [Portunus trituberculatus]|uniref:Uncharacterized protein n=1 Tax=Portunus trituberculatus TaxID=210409 RepID=A0A5B7FIH8_PORTR|nr:hypothetical protein [Portunus trituberculatus]